MGRGLYVCSDRGTNVLQRTIRDRPGWTATSCTRPTSWNCWGFRGRCARSSPHRALAAAAHDRQPLADPPHERQRFPQRFQVVTGIDRANRVRL